MSFENRTI